jgi:hypothetical protein
MKYLILACTLLSACTIKPPSPAIGTRIALSTPAIACMTQSATRRMLNAAAEKNDAAFLGSMVTEGGTCMQLPSGFAVVVTAFSSDGSLAGVRAADVATGGTIWMPMQMLTAASPSPASTN